MVRFRNCIWKDVSVINSHLNCIFDQDRLDAWQWSDEVASLVSETLDKRNDVRYDAACKLGDLGNPVVAPSLACLLVDPEWEVRSISLEAMAKLRSHEGFPNRDSIILEWMFLCLGDEHSIVRQTARELVKVLAPTDRILLASTRRIMGKTSTSKLAGLRASLELCYYLNIEYSRLVNIKTVESLLEDEDEEVRDLSKSLFDEYNYARSLIQQVTTQKQTHLNQIDQTDATQPLDENSQLKQGSHNYNKSITESHQPPKYINNPDNSFNFEGATYMLQRRPMHPHIVINNKYEGISILEPWSGKQVLQVNFPSCYDPYGIIDGWCFRSDGKAVLTFNKQSSTACLLSLEINGASYNFESPKLQNFADLRYIWENNSFWLTGGKSLGYFNLIWQEGLPVFVQKGGIKATIAHKNWRSLVGGINCFKATVLRLQTDLSQILYYDASEQPPDIKISNWHLQTTRSVVIPEYVSIAAFNERLVFLAYEHEVHAINQQGQVETIYSVPPGFYCGGIDTLTAIANYPASLILACSSWNEPKQTQILVYQLDN